MTRSEAIAKGLDFYMGKTCKYGHLDSLRYTTGGACVECRRNGKGSEHVLRVHVPQSSIAAFALLCEAIGVTVL